MLSTGEPSGYVVDDEMSTDVDTDVDPDGETMVVDDASSDEDESGFFPFCKRAFDVMQLDEGPFSEEVGGLDCSVWSSSDEYTSSDDDRCSCSSFLDLVDRANDIVDEIRGRGEFDGSSMVEDVTDPVATNSGVARFGVINGKCPTDIADKLDDLVNFGNMHDAVGVAKAEMLFGEYDRYLSDLRHIGVSINEWGNWYSKICVDEAGRLEWDTEEWDDYESLGSSVDAASMIELLDDLKSRVRKILMSPAFEFSAEDVDAAFAERGAVLDIKKEQRRADLVADRDVFRDDCFGISDNICDGLKWEPEALHALQVAAEGYLVDLFEKSGRAAIHAGRDIVCPADMRFVEKLGSA